MGILAGASAFLIVVGHGGGCAGPMSSTLMSLLPLLSLDSRSGVNAALLGSRCHTRHQPVCWWSGVWDRQEDRARVHRAARQLRLEPLSDTPVLFGRLSCCCCPDAVVPRCRRDARRLPGRGFRGRVQHAGGSKPVCERSRMTRGTCGRQWF